MHLWMKKNGTEYFYDDKWIYAQKANAELFKLAVFDKHLYKLRLWNGIPLLEIDGVRMHLVKDFHTPLEYPKYIVKKLKIKEKDVVLDTCMGLGYTAIACLGAKQIITCEINDAVYTLATWNPISNKLFSDKIEIVRGDIFEKIKKFDDASFFVILHDPPRFSHAPSLYSTSFYKELFRVAKNGARLFHYVGSVGKLKGRNIADKVKKRLEEIGFKNLKYDKRAQGLFFIK